jgi:hypothetical protein
MAGRRPEAAVKGGAAEAAVKGGKVKGKRLIGGLVAQSEGGVRFSGSYSYSYFLLILKNVGRNDDQWFTTVE